MKSVPLISGGLSFLLSACSGGGSFDVDNVSNPSSSKPRYQDDTSSSRKKSDLENLSIPSLGGGMKLVAQNFTGAKEPSFLNENGYMIFSSLSTIKKDVEDNNKNKDTPLGSIKEPDANSQDSNSQKYVYSGLYYIENWSDFSKSRAAERKAYTGYYGYAFYYGNKTATNLPVNGVAKYKGTWSFITATKNGQSYSLLSNDRQAYSRRSAIPTDIDLEKDPKNGETGLISQFSADFGNKKLTGELFYTKRQTKVQEYKKEKLYDIDADIYSNRFRGKVDPAQKDSTEHPFTSEGVLEGGFYGPKGEELGGKFLAGDKKVFGVFSAKETEETKNNPKLRRETLIDGKLTTFKRTDATTSTTANTAANATTDATANAKNFTTEDISSFGEADYLLIDNYPIPLLPESGDFISSKHHEVGNKRYKVEACCSNLSYVKFGMYYEDPLKKEEENEKDKEKHKEKHKEKQATTSINTYYQFLLGHRTPKDDIPKQGSAKYLGSWFGYISDGTTSYSPSGDKKRENNAVAEFNVDFDQKKLTGELKRHDNGNTVFSIQANFNSGNDFTGTATANNVAIDSQNTQANTSRVNFTATVKGAFYGPKATELGGYFTYNGKDTITKNSESSPAVSSSPNSKNARAAVVFGAKQQVETTK
ncbi:transferrin-binding protein-like solute binding protein [Haemophilus influenzae]|uniref:transferrin-binding protein-like solute binding protein n=1 Tax=Haemophilus influenzae TaxID=727 RepID=UPI000E331EEC|nr:transferrin-binding protein-like solute binding protein [Haemophilus influenzae]AXP67258.1 transferrin-binding protein-like solute binding protein [Haemophilus influenzae]AYO35331.1 transferrin-binding protein-like solute binding protein [Haemophilus influenzae]MCK9648694.1 transferrin-binding protein-like solute binding protein [Haemophilus influenzae]MCK9652080.1 transferrin-binding protein-like solute binding protein [Haemophilus influenzae]RFO26135.1 transferrin-binding protein-like sol